MPCHFFICRASGHFALAPFAMQVPNINRVNAIVESVCSSVLFFTPWFLDKWPWEAKVAKLEMNTKRSANFPTIGKTCNDSGLG